jgi:hypothetical protein
MSSMGMSWKGSSICCAISSQDCSRRRGGGGGAEMVSRQRQSSVPPPCSCSSRQPAQAAAPRAPAALPACKRQHGAARLRLLPAHQQQRRDQHDANEAGDCWALCPHPKRQGQAPDLHAAQLAGLIARLGAGGPGQPARGVADVPQYKQRRQAEQPGGTQHSTLRQPEAG